MICTTGIPSGLTHEVALASLSNREAEVVRMVAGADGAAEISAELGLTEPTARNYLYKLCQALHLRGVRELQLWAMQNPDAIVSDPKARRPGRCGLHPKTCACGSPYCAMRVRLLTKKAA